MKNASTLALALAFLTASLFGQQNPPPLPQQQPSLVVPNPPQRPAAPVAPISDTVVLPKGTPVCLFPSRAVSTKTAKVNDRVSFRVGRDISVEGITLIVGSTEVWATLHEVRRSGIGGKDGKLSFTFEPVPLVNGKTVPIQPFHPPKGLVIQPPKPQTSIGKEIKDALDDPYDVWWPVAAPFALLLPFEKGQEQVLPTSQCVPGETAVDSVVDRWEAMRPTKDVAPAPGPTPLPRQDR